MDPDKFIRILAVSTHMTTVLVLLCDTIPADHHHTLFTIAFNWNERGTENKKFSYQFKWFCHHMPPNFTSIDHEPPSQG